MEKKNSTKSKGEIMLDDLTSVLGFDTTKTGRPSSDVFNTVLEEIKEEEAVKTRAIVKEMIVKARAEATAFYKAKKEFQKIEQSFEKNFAKTLKSIQALANGDEQPTDEEPTEEKAS